MQEAKIESWSDFEQVILELNAHLLELKPHPLIPPARPLYRGHADACWTLTTTLERFRSKPTSVEQYNRYLLRIQPAVESYTEKKWPLVEEPTLPSNGLSSIPNYEFVIYARHHGFPSPLLDWSQSPYVALYFAYADSKPDKIVAVFAYVSAPHGDKAGWSNAANITEPNPYVTTHARHFRQQAQYTFCVHHEPENRWDYCSHGEVFKLAHDRQDLLRKFILPSDKRIEFLQRLQLMNINAYSLFSNEEALMRMLAFKEITLTDL